MPFASSPWTLCALSPLPRAANATSKDGATCPRPCGGGRGDRAMAVSVVQLPGLCPGRARSLNAVEPLVGRVLSEASLSATALEGIHPGRGSEGGNNSGARLGDRRRELSSADAAAAGAPGSPAPRPAAGSADAKGWIFATTSAGDVRRVNFHLDLHHGWQQATNFPVTPEEGAILLGLVEGQDAVS